MFQCLGMFSFSKLNSILSQQVATIETQQATKEETTVQKKGCE